MGFDDFKKLKDQQKDFIATLEEEKEMFLKEFEQMMRKLKKFEKAVKKQKDELEGAINQLHQSISNQGDSIDNNITLNMIPSDRESTKDECEGYRVIAGKMI